MRNSLIILFLFICVSTIAQVNDSIIYWSKAYKLGWGDFKGDIPDSTNTQAAISFIQIYTSSKWDQGLPYYKVFATFRKNDSWSKVSTISTLTHEQIHFDIGEVFARKMRKALMELREREIDSIDEYLNVINVLHDDFLKVNAIYDWETGHGIYKLKQKEWNKKIAKELCELKEYEVNYEEYLEEE